MPARNRKHLDLVVWTFLATAEHLLLPGLRPKLLPLLGFLSCVPWWARSRNQAAGLPVGCTNWAPLSAGAGPIHDLLTVLVQLELAPFCGPTTLHLLLNLVPPIGVQKASLLASPLGPQPTLFLVCLLLNMPFLYK